MRPETFRAALASDAKDEGLSTRQTMFGNLGFGELTIIMVIVLVLFGAKRVPEISASFGKGIREFKRNLNEVEHSVISGVTDAPRPERAWSALPAAEPVVESEVEGSREPKRLM
jgi:sec-independent protein translocase protein TatA